MWNSNDILTSQKLNEMENFVSSKSTSYSKTTWQDEDIVTADKLNNLENGVLLSNSSYSKHTWVDNEEITAVKLNNITGGLNFWVGNEIIKDGITSVCIYKAPIRQEWGQYIFADKSHDLCYYIDGDDYVNSNNYEQAPGTFGYEWGGYGTPINNSQIIGTGLSNTNSLISMNLQSDTPGWRVLWDMVEQFRSSHSNDWFVPSLYELLEVYDSIYFLENLSTSTRAYYWSSSELNSYNSYYVFFDTGTSYHGGKSLHSFRSRLCFYL